MTTRPAQPRPPRYRSPARQPGIHAMLTRALSDPASVLPAAIYDDWALKLPGPRSPIVLMRPEAVRAVLLDKGDRFGRNPHMRTLLRRAWGAGLAAVEGECWERQRHAATPAFRPAAVQAAVPAMARAADRAAHAWRADSPVELTAACARIVAEIVMTTLLTGLDDPDFDAIASDVPDFVRAFSQFGLLDLLPIPEAAIDRLRGIGRGAPEKRLRALALRIAVKRTEPPDATQDIPALMRGAGPLADNILGFLPAGLETTAVAAAWAIYLLARYPEWQEAVSREAATDDGHGAALTITRQVVQETLRLYPPGPLLVRAAVARGEIEGHRLYPRQVIIVPVFAIHRHRHLWDRPDAFDPMRFAPGEKYDRGAFLPFGIGPRMCIAATFAQTEIAVIVAELVRRFAFTPHGPDPVVGLKTVTRSLNGLWVTASVRGRTP